MVLLTQLKQKLGFSPKVSDTELSQVLAQLHQEKIPLLFERKNSQFHYVIIHDVNQHTHSLKLLNLSQDNRQRKWRQGSSIVLQCVLNRGVQVTFECRIKTICTEDTLIVSLPYKVKMKDRRKEPRIHLGYSSDVSVNVKLESKLLDSQILQDLSFTRGSCVLGQVVDISLTGLQLSLDNNITDYLKKQRSLVVLLKTPNAKEKATLSVKLKVSWFSYNEANNKTYLGGKLQTNASNLAQISLLIAQLKANYYHRYL